MALMPSPLVFTFLIVNIKLNLAIAANSDLAYLHSS